MQRNNNPSLQLLIEQFYYDEANLLDNRQFIDWLNLLSDDISYSIPGRSAVQLDSQLRESQALLAPEHELDDTDIQSCPLREENKLILSVRAQRAYKLKAWASNPPARTRRLVSNIIIEHNEDHSTLAISSNFMLHYSKHRDDNHLYSGQRQDTLIKKDEQWLIQSRKIIFDWNVIPVPTVGLFL